MLSIRLQRTGRKGHAQYRVIVQDSRMSPKSGKFVARLGHYDPHTKVAVLDKKKAATFVKNGAQPSDRVVTLFKAEKIDLPAWVREPQHKERKLRNPDKLRKNQPAETAAPVEALAEPEAEKPVEEPAEEPKADIKDEATKE